jgi:phytanoyl-CoA hydroxylase
MQTGRQLSRFQKLAIETLQKREAPLELEASLGYPGAPESVETGGGETIRRLLGAYQRNPAWKEWATSHAIKTALQQLFADEKVYLNQSHHNCLMTKSPEYSSDTGWHQDIRYWSFEQRELISVWLALGKEQPQNGGLWVIPESHRLEYSTEQFDEQIFFRQNLASNEALIQHAEPVLLSPGDVLFFDSRLLHRASRNTTRDIRYSLIFTYHSSSNRPKAGTRSAAFDEVLLT